MTSISIQDIPIGRKNAISRSELAMKWNCSDREARAKIADLKAMETADNYAVVSLSSGKGYYRTDDLEEIRHSINEIKKRGRNTFRPVKNLERIYKRISEASSNE